MRKKKTTEQFIEELKLKRPDITVLGEYVKSNLKVEIQHSCGYQWEITPNNLFQGKSCPECYKIEVSNKRTKTTEQFIEALKIVNPEITVIGKYLSAKTKIKVKHTCGYQWNPIPSSLLQGSSCPKCSKIEVSNKRTKTMKQFIKELKIVNPEITVIGKYQNNKTKIEVKHTCGYQWNPTPNSLLKGSSCPKCSKIEASKKRTKTTKQFIEELKVVNPEITVIGKYGTDNNKIEIKHTCGYQWGAIPGNLLQGTSCPKCFGTLKKTTEQFIEELKIVNPEITVTGKYQNNKTKIEVKHTCGYQWNTTPNSLLQGNSCPKCNESKGEKFLSKVLTGNKISFTSQFNLVKNPKTNRWLRSDFAILDKDKNPLLILEYDGEQHFKAVDIFGGEKALKHTQYRDALKDNYCKANNIPYLRFSYLQSELEIQTLLFKKLRNLSF